MKEKQQGLIAILSANVIFGLNIQVTKALMAQWMTRLFSSASSLEAIGSRNRQHFYESTTHCRFGCGYLARTERVYGG